ncbi:hypothetical protein [Gordonia rhizosphera]|uniref:Polysaccharide chain length determinant N-terminal domain-containing protein n=1 Tax=Gordonia rhizosphera NBRC 16068 TaxID=1108045 RepID=K6WJK9_9ACTN|nr:hypothetical protein [Gordonia rhizosphera]GAB92317.1 hypothetical protein GORHZ_170_00010 [Gordonia rhizosphera NBRC 16068]
MTVLDFAAAVVRRWLVVALGVSLTVAALLFVNTRPPTYASQADVTLLPPVSGRYPNSFTDSGANVMYAAGLLERTVNKDHRVTATSSTTIGLVDIGIRNGWMIRFPNYGGQWAYYFRWPTLDVQAVSPSEEGARAAMRETLNKVQQTLLDMQYDYRVAPYNRINLRMSPPDVEVTASTGNTRRASVVTLLLGIGLTGAAVVESDRWLRRRRERRDEKKSKAETAPAEDALV